jgi:hypothetical protein
VLRFDDIPGDIWNCRLSVRVIHDVIAKTIRASKLAELDVSGNAKEPRFGRSWSSGLRGLQTRSCAVTERNEAAFDGAGTSWLVRAK